MPSALYEIASPNVSFGRPVVRGLVFSAATTSPFGTSHSDASVYVRSTTFLPPAATDPPVTTRLKILANALLVVSVAGSPSSPTRFSGTAVSPVLTAPVGL